jgi:hypothetical protein
MDITFDARSLFNPRSGCRRIPGVTAAASPVKQRTEPLPSNQRLFRLSIRLEQTGSFGLDFFSQ